MLHAGATIAIVVWWLVHLCNVVATLADALLIIKCTGVSTRHMCKHTPARSYAHTYAPNKQTTEQTYGSRTGIVEILGCNDLGLQKREVIGDRAKILVCDSGSSARGAQVGFAYQQQITYASRTS